MANQRKVYRVYNHTEEYWLETEDDVVVSADERPILIGHHIRFAANYARKHDYQIVLLLDELKEKEDESHDYIIGD